MSSSELLSPSNERFLRRFRTYLQLERSLSKHSIEAYIRDLTLFISGLPERPPMSLSQVDTQTIRNVLSHHIAGSYAASTQSRILSALRTFYKFLLLEHEIEVNPMRGIDSPRLPRRLPDVLSSSEVMRIIEATVGSEHHPQRDRAIIEVLYGCGLRVSELVDLKVSGLYLDKQYIRVIGKGDRERLVPIGQSAIAQLQNYMGGERLLQTIHPKAEDIVFINNRGQKLTRNMIFIMIQKYVMGAGLNKSVSPHSFRHAFATHLIEGGADIRAVQDMLGHESITTTEIYTHLNSEFLEQEIREHHPRSTHKPKQS